MASMTRAEVDAWRMQLQVNHDTNGRSFSFVPLTTH
jgi:hypothetical protein